MSGLIFIGFGAMTQDRLIDLATRMTKNEKIQTNREAVNDFLSRHDLNDQDAVIIYVAKEGDGSGIALGRKNDIKVARERLFEFFENAAK